MNCVICKSPLTAELAEIKVFCDACIAAEAKRQKELMVQKSHDVAEKWWTEFAYKLAEKMRHSQIKSFKIFLNDAGRYEFEVNPITTTTVNAEH